MGSIGSVNNISDLAFTGPSDSSYLAATRHIPPEPPIEDQVQIASIPSAAQVEQLQSTNPSTFQQVVADAIGQLRTAEAQSTDPGEVAVLSGQAASFERMEDS
ncbi:MAG TPA: hypothetical protein VGG72_19085 [Bryobacteraceae bacterium]|jgi:hypothetical protein